MRVTAAVLADPAARCPGCGLTLRNILALRRAGCARCYRAFARDLEPLRPDSRRGGDAAAAARWRRWRALSAELDEAVLTERFERAAVIKAALTRLRASAPG